MMWFSGFCSAKSFVCSRMCQTDLCNWKAKCSSRTHACRATHWHMVVSGFWGPYMVWRGLNITNTSGTCSQAMLHDHCVMSLPYKKAFLDQYHWVPWLCIAIAQTHNDSVEKFAVLCGEIICMTQRQRLKKIGQESCVSTLWSLSPQLCDFERELSQCTEKIHIYIIQREATVFNE